MKQPILVRIASELFKLCDDFGPLHIVVSDGNVEDWHIEACQSKDLKPEEADLLELLLKMTLEEREKAWEISCNFGDA